MTSKPWILHLGRSMIVALPLPPSTNARMRPVRMGRFCRDILTAEAREYIDQVGCWLALRRQIDRVPVLKDYAAVNCWLILPRTNCDPHNYFKVAMDTIERAGWVENDKHILPQTRGIWHDAQDPRFIFEWTRSETRSPLAP